MTDVLRGSCLCEAVTYSVENRFEAFYFCHCEQCQKVTGSGFASNIITSPENIEWLTGFENVRVFEHPSREFSKGFCKKCGAGVPYINKSKTNLVIPAGSLIDLPTISPIANLFKGESPRWLEAGLLAKNFNGFPK